MFIVFNHSEYFYLNGRQGFGLDDAGRLCVRILNGKQESFFLKHRVVVFVDWN
jgi:hypothetical protein